jgi:hypothetical protein
LRGVSLALDLVNRQPNLLLLRTQKLDIRCEVNGLFVSIGTLEGALSDEHAAVPSTACSNCRSVNLGQRCATVASARLQNELALL